MSKLTVGADPEFFVRKRQHYVSGHIFHCGTKRHPLPTEHGHVQVDGIAIECNVKPSNTRDEFISNVRGVVSDIDAIVRGVDNSMAIVAKPSIFFGHRRLQQIPVENARLGCDPDFNAWTLRPNHPPDMMMPFRTGAGHLHIGWTENQSIHDRDHLEDCRKIVRQLDYYLGLPSLLWDRDDRRRSLYGKAGAFRPKSYGVEYRTLSNAWVDTDKLIGWVFDRAVAACRSVWAQQELVADFEALARELIDNNVHDWNKQHPDIAEAVLVP